MALATLCVTEITSWGVLYYAFTVLSPEISRDTGWSPSAVTGAFSAGLLVAAVAGVPVGRLLDRVGPRPVMTAGAVVAPPALLAVAAAPTLPLFVAAWVLAGVAMSALFYQPAFAALTRWYGPRRVAALTTLTLAGGLASTVFAPITAALTAGMSWRGVYVVLAAVLVAVALPGHLFGLRPPWPPVDGRRDGPRRQAQPSDSAIQDDPTNPGDPGDPGGPCGPGACDPRAVARSRPFLVLSVATCLGALAIYATIVNTVPLLTGRGLATSTAALALGLGGAGQVLGRLGYGRLNASTGVRVRTTIILGAGAATTCLLGLIPGPPGLLLAATVLAGAARGVFTLLMATAVTDRWGAAHYGRLSGLLTAPVTFATAVAPWAGASLAGVLGGYPHVFLALAGLGVAATLTAWGSYPASVTTRGAGG